VNSRFELDTSVESWGRDGTGGAKLGEAKKPAAVTLTAATPDPADIFVVSLPIEMEAFCPPTVPTSPLSMLIMDFALPIVPTPLVFERRPVDDERFRLFGCLGW
jgi:hypothetical protein